VSGISYQTEETLSSQKTDTRFVPVKVLRPRRDENRSHQLKALDSKLIGESQPMRDLKNSIEMVATSEETVLITGESGTGKEVIARAIHDLSPRRRGPFQSVNCGAIVESLAESLLFGHAKGSFTGAGAYQKGYFEAASGGTIFLDEFAEMSLAMQARLLRVLQEQKVRPVGWTDAREIEIDARVVVATNHDLPRDISEGRFRNDLYYRINVLELRAPALRDRQEDLLPLAQHFIRNYNLKNARRVSEHIDPELLAILQAYSWPGNVRELDNIIKKFAVRVGENGTITGRLAHYVPELNCMVGCRQEGELSADQREPPHLRHCDAGYENAESVDQFKRQELALYLRQLDQVGGNVAEAARRLKIKRTTLRKRILGLKSKYDRAVV
jgi:transcriptional regulator with PAS, ATPase and Fis domain